MRGRCHPLRIRVTQEDGAQAWPFPVYPRRRRPIFPRAPRFVPFRNRCRILGRGRSLSRRA